VALAADYPTRAEVAAMIEQAIAQALRHQQPPGDRRAQPADGLTLDYEAF
jgi:hypothetical protein